MMLCVRVVFGVGSYVLYMLLSICPIAKLSPKLVDRRRGYRNFRGRTLPTTERYHFEQIRAR